MNWLYIVGGILVALCLVSYLIMKYSSEIEPED